MNNQMQEAEVKRTIEQRLMKLAKVNSNLYNDWVDILFDSNGNEIKSEWNTQNLNKMESDVLEMAMLFFIWVADVPVVELAH